MYAVPAMTKQRAQDLVVGLVVILLFASALGYLLVPSAMLGIVGIDGNPQVTFLVRTLAAALLALSPGAWAARRRDRTSGQRGVLIGLAGYMFASSLVDLYGFMNQIVGVAAVPSIVLRGILGAVLVWLIPARDGLQRKSGTANRKPPASLIGRLSRHSIGYTDCTDRLLARWRSAVDFGAARSSVRCQRHFEAEEGQMAKYLILIYGQESDAPATAEQWDQMMQAHGRFAEAVDEQRGKILGGEALQPTATATSVRDDGQTVTGGPFVATNEALGGFYLVEAADPEQALAFAKLCPAPGGGVELRPIMDTSGGPPST